MWYHQCFETVIWAYVWYDCCISLLLLISWLSALEGTKWLQHLSLLLKASLLVCDPLDRGPQACAGALLRQGWDRTPQIVASVQLIAGSLLQDHPGLLSLSHTNNTHTTSHTHTRAHTHTHAHTHTYIHTTHTHTLTHTNTHTHTHTRTLTHTYTHTHTHNTHTHTHTHTRTHTHTHTLVRTHTHAHTHTYIHAHSH